MSQQEPLSRSATDGGRFIQKPKPESSLLKVTWTLAHFFFREMKFEFRSAMVDLWVWWGVERCPADTCRRWGSLSFPLALRLISSWIHYLMDYSGNYWGTNWLLPLWTCLGDHVRNKMQDYWLTFKACWLGLALHAELIITVFTVFRELLNLVNTVWMHTTA